MQNSITKKKLIIILVLCLLFVMIILPLAIFIINFYSELSFLFCSKDKEKWDNRALILVVEDNHYSEGNLGDFYYQNKKVLQPVIAFMVGVQPKQLEDLSAGDIIDQYIEPFSINRYKNAGYRYSEIVVLTDTDATIENFAIEVEKLSLEGYSVDILFSLHGNTDVICFYGSCYKDTSLVQILKGRRTNINYIYQTLCYGGSLLNVYEEIGVQEANGAKGLNSLVVFAPEKFLQNISNDMEFKDSVENAKDFELNFWHKVAKIFPFMQEMMGDFEADSNEMMYFQN